MNISTKEKKSIQQFLYKFKLNSFVENDIKLFLIEVREYLKEETFLRELADFIAHGTRDKGICYTAVKSRHMRMHSSRKRINELMDSGFFEANKDKPESFFSRKFLDYIDFKKVAKNDFKIYITDALEDLDESFVEEQTQFKKEFIKILISASYRQENGYYILKSNLKKESVLILDDLLLFIRGAITPKGIFTQQEIMADFNSIVTKVNGAIAQEGIHQNSYDDLMVCIMAMMHDRRFKLGNGALAHCYLNIENANMDDSEVKKDWTLNVNVEADKFGFPIITTNINPERYIKDFKNLYGSVITMESIAEIYTKRDTNKRLYLTQ